MFHLALSILVCVNGTFAENCERECGACLNGDFCNIVNGSCPAGCNPGYHGDRCDIGEL